jgi:hypothetical protein
MSISNGKFRRRKTNFSAVSNAALQDKNLSLKAKGLYALIESYNNIPNFDLYKKFLMDRCMEGDKAFNSAWNELKQKGYLKVYRIPGANHGRFSYEYELLDVADPSSPSIINLDRNGEIPKPSQSESSIDETSESFSSIEDIPEEPASVPDFDHTPQKGVYGQTDEKTSQNSTDHTPHLAPYAQSTICSKHRMLQGGNINNNEINNTEINNIKSINQSKEDDRRTDSLREKLKRQIEYDYFEENYADDLPSVNILIDCMADMLSAPATRINGCLQERDTLKRYIDQADAETIRDFLEHMRGCSVKEIKNITAYWRSSLINYLRDHELAMYAL